MEGLARKLVDELVERHGPCDEERIAQVLLSFWAKNNVTTVEHAERLFDLAEPMIVARLERLRGGARIEDSRPRLN
jgi:hypothetical protein